MKTIELSDALTVIEKFERQERKTCAQYCELNPADKERRERDRDLIIYAAQIIYSRLHDAARPE